MDNETVADIIQNNVIDLIDSITNIPPGLNLWINDEGEIFINDSEEEFVFTD